MKLRHFPFVGAVILTKYVLLVVHYTFVYNESMFIPLDLSPPFVSAMAVLQDG